MLSRVASCFILILLVAGCGARGTESFKGRGQNRTKIMISGSATVDPISARVAERFAKQYSHVAITVDGPGTGDGFELFCKGQVDIADASRQIKPEEIASCKKHGIDFVELNIANDGLSVITSKANDKVNCLGRKDLYALVGPESNTFGRWNSADGLATKIGARHFPYPNAPMRITAPGPESGTYDTFVELVIKPTADERGQKATLRKSDFTTSPNENVIIQGVAGDKSSLGWVGFTYAHENRNKVKTIAIDNGHGQCIEPTPETVANGSYPLTRPLFLYVDKARVKSDQALKDFIEFYLGAQGQQSVADAHSVQLNPAELSQTRAAWMSALTS